jgi:hypothetical protein
MSEFNQNEPNNLAGGEVEYEEEEQNEVIEESSDDFDAGAIKNKFETREIEDIQQEIQNVTKKIEHEKINLRITEERYEKTKNEYNKLQGKPEVKTKEDKEKERKEKKEKQKIKIEDQKKEPKQQNKHQILNETAKKKFFELMKQESEIDSLTKQINQVNLDCEDLKQQIEYLRKQKNSNETQLNDINKKNDKLTKDTKKLKEKNINTNKNIDETDQKELNNEEQKGKEQNSEFLRKRDKLEDKYHKIIEAKILRERERKKEQAQKRQMLGMMAMNAMNAMNNNKKTVGFKEIEDRIKTLKAQEISDRIPILDEVINKWKEINKVKKVMLEKYNKNAETIKDAFDIIMKFLGLYSYDELPIIFQKNEDQISSVEMYISELTNEKNSKEEHKKNLEKQIKELEEKIDKREFEKTGFKNIKESNIKELENKIKEVEDDIKEKRDFFEKLKPDTEKFLNKMNNTYVRDYVPNIISLKDLKYSEDNIKLIIDNIQNYYTLITEFKQSFKEKHEDNVNLEIDKLREDMKNKLENFKKENYSKKLKKDLSNYGQNYDETIRRTAETIVEATNEGNMNLTKSKIKI